MKVTIEKDRFYFDGKLTYEEMDSCPQQYKGLLMNARFIQGVFDDFLQPERFHRFGKVFQPKENTDRLIAALPEWYSRGLRAFTVGFQGGGPCFTISNSTVRNSPYSEDGKALDAAYCSRMKKLIQAADDLGMAVIVSLFYGAQTRFLKDDSAVLQAVKTAAGWLKSIHAENVMIEIANEHDIEEYRIHPVLYQENGIVTLMEIARRESGGMPVGCSGTGGYFSRIIAEASDVIFIHGNGQTRNQFYRLIRKAKEVTPARPIVCNEDSQAISQLEVAFHESVSWGYYNNMTKQEPPTDWGITRGEDQFFAARLAQFLGRDEGEPPFEEQFYLQGLEPEMEYENKRFVRLASLYPERINRVEFYRDGRLYDTAYDDPFMVHYICNWLQDAVTDTIDKETWKAIIYLFDGREVEKKVVLQKGTTGQ